MSNQAEVQTVPQDELTALRTRIEVLTAQRNRLMGENEGLIHEIKLLHQRFANITEPASGRPVAESGVGRTRPGPVVAPAGAKRPTPSTVEGLDL